MPPTFIMNGNDFLRFQCFDHLHGFLCRKSKPDRARAEEASLSDMQNGSTDGKMFCNFTNPFEPDGIARDIKCTMFLPGPFQYKSCCFAYDQMTSERSMPRRYG